MKSVKNIAKAEILLDGFPKGSVSLVVAVPYLAKVLAFLLNRYILGD